MADGSIRPALRAIGGVLARLVPRWKRPVTGARRIVVEAQALAIALAILLGCALPALARGGGGCFPAGTPVALADGADRPIEALRPGDEVVAFDEGRTIAARVRRVFTLESDAGLIEVKTASGALVRATPEHPFLLADGSWREAGALGVGDALVRATTPGVAGIAAAFLGDTSPASSGTSGVTAPDRIVAMRRISGAVRVYNLEVDEPHTFIAAGLVVHNKGKSSSSGRSSSSSSRSSSSSSRSSSSSSSRRTSSSSSSSSRRYSGTSSSSRSSSSSTSRPSSSSTRSSGSDTPSHPPPPTRYVPGAFLTDPGVVPARPWMVTGTSETEEQRRVRVDKELLAIQAKEDEELERVYTARREAQRERDRLAFYFCFLLPIGGIFGIAFLDGWLRSRRGGGPASSAAVGGDAAGEELDHTFTPAQYGPKAAKTKKLLSVLAKNDPDFAPERLDETIRTAFLTLQKVWSARDYTEMRPLVFPDLAREHEKQLRSMVENHERNVIEDPRIELLEVVHLRYTAVRRDRQVTALIQCSLVDRYEDDRTGAHIRGETERTTFQELWTFQVHLSPRGGHAPSLPASEWSWKLREIEQTKESTALTDENFVEILTPQQLAEAYGEALADAKGEAGPSVVTAQADRGRKIHRLLNFLVQTDKVWNEKRLIDACRSACIALHAALEANDDAPLNGHAHPDFLPGFRADAERRRKDGIRLEFRNICVRKVTLLLVRNRQDAKRDEILARVAAHAQRFVWRGETAQAQDDDVRRSDAIYRMQREGDRFLLAEVLPDATSDRILAEENVDEESTPEQLAWYYTKARPGL